jgi:hypothetical protein
MTFTLRNIITNTDNSSESQLILRKMLAYFYEVYTGGSPEAGRKK